MRFKAGQLPHWPLKASVPVDELPQILQTGLIKEAAWDSTHTRLHGLLDQIGPLSLEFALRSTTCTFSPLSEDSGPVKRAAPSPCAQLSPHHGIWLS